MYHYGIKGQKHGVRRFQNEDGSLTPAGKERYAKYTDRVLDSSTDLAAVGADVTANQAQRRVALKKAELNVKVSKVTGHTKMAQAKLLAQKGKNALGLAKDAMRLGLAAAKTTYNTARMASFMDSLMKSSSYSSKTDRDLQSVAKDTVKKWAGKKTGLKLLSK